MLPPSPGHKHSFPPEILGPVLRRAVGGLLLVKSFAY